MTARWGIVVGVLVIAAGIAWFAMHRGGSADGDTTSSKASQARPTSAPEGSANLTSSARGSGSATGRDGKVDLSPKSRPEHFGAANEQPPPVSGTAFEAQSRDADWAPAAEREIKRRFAVGIREGKLDSTECRQDQCLLTMSGTEDEMSKALADLETEGGLRGYADHIVLDGPVQQNGKMIVRAYAVFDRRNVQEN
jgi:hypothetical protein